MLPVQGSISLILAPCSSKLSWTLTRRPLKKKLIPIIEDIFGTPTVTTNKSSVHKNKLFRYTKEAHSPNDVLQLKELQGIIDNQLSNEINQNSKNWRSNNYGIHDNFIHEESPYDSIISEQSKSKIIKFKFDKKRKIKKNKKNIKSVINNPILTVYENNSDDLHSSNPDEKEVLLGRYSGKKTWVYNKKNAKAGLYVIEVRVFEFNFFSKTLNISTIILFDFFIQN